MRGAEGIPKGEGGVVVLIGGQLMDLSVHAAVASVDIVEELRPERHVIERGVEDSFLLGVGDLGIHATELLPPLLLSCCAGAVEVPIGLLGLQISGGTLGADARDPGAHRDDLIGVGAEVQHGLEIVALQVAGSAHGFVVGIEHNAVRLLGELQGEVAVTVVAPGTCDVAAGEGIGRGLAELCRVDGGAAVGEIAVGEVDDDPGVLALRKRVLVDAGALGGGEFGAHLWIFQEHGVVAGLGDLIVVREARTVALVRLFAGTRLEFDGACAGHDEEVEQIAAAGAAQVGVAEAHDGGVGDVVAGAPVPAVVEGIGAELEGGERNAGSGEAVAVAAGADARIDPA